MPSTGGSTASCAPGRSSPRTPTPCSSSGRTIREWRRRKRSTAARTWGGEDFTKYEGGVYSAEWFWSKILHVLRADEKVRNAACSWVELCDWVPALLTGKDRCARHKRSRCAAGHKAMWHPSFGGLPPEEFLAGIDPLLAGVRAGLYPDTRHRTVLRVLCGEWAERLGLRRTRLWGSGPSMRTWARSGGNRALCPYQGHRNIHLRHNGLSDGGDGGKTGPRHLRAG